MARVAHYQNLILFSQTRRSSRRCSFAKSHLISQEQLAFLNRTKSNGGKEDTVEIGMQQLRDAVFDIIWGGHAC